MAKCFSRKYFFIHLLNKFPYFLKTLYLLHGRWAVIVGGDELKWRRLIHNHLMSPIGRMASIGIMMCDRFSIL